jgi:hypothetical protein
MVPTEAHFLELLAFLQPRAVEVFRRDQHHVPMIMAVGAGPNGKLVPPMGIMDASHYRQTGSDVEVLLLKAAINTLLREHDLVVFVSEGWKVKRDTIEEALRGGAAQDPNREQVLVFHFYSRSNEYTVDNKIVTDSDGRKGLELGAWDNKVEVIGGRFSSLS